MGLSVHRLAAAAVLVSCLASLNFAASTPWQTNEHGRVRLISQYDAAARNGEIYLALHFQPAPGWYLYWKDPGEAGIPPRINWAGTQGLENPEFLWPQPDKIVLPGDIVEYGYEREMVYPIHARVKGSAVTIQAKMSYLTCNSACIPYTYTFSMTLPARASPRFDDEASGLIQKYLSQVPPASLTDDQIKERATVYHKTPGKPISTSSTSALPHLRTMLLMLLLAFVGGLILNVMPCVLPVLAIKLAGLLQHSGQSKSSVIQSSLASAAGIVVSFLALALAAVLLRQAGHAVGWGIQFQNPAFVIFLMVVVLLFAFNLWGVFEIQIPRFLGHFATSFGYHESLSAHFTSGLFATLLATPCTAPFLGTALGFALAQPAYVILLIFFSVGVGMALPYFVLAAFPHSIRWLPRPGNWMITLKKFLAVLLFLTAAWLGWVLFQQLRATTGDSPHVNTGTVPSRSGISWIKFDESAIAGYLKEGKPVFVDITADWCVTCKYNERFVLSDRAVVAEFNKRGVVMMQGDWTNQNETIANYLKKYGRAGIPFYALYYPIGDPKVLPELLTKKRILQELKAWDSQQ